MGEESDFSALYKKLIDGHFAPERQRAQSALFAVLSRLSEEGPEEDFDLPDCLSEEEPEEDFDLPDPPPEPGGPL